MQLCFSSGFAFIPCELGERMTNFFNEINDEFDQLNWYRFPIDAQKMLPIILNIVQKPVMIHCFGSVFCTREIFKDVS